MPKILTHRKSCRFCNSRHIKPVLRFEATPLEVVTNAATDEAIAEERQPLILSVCEKCKLVQLLDITNPDILFRNNPDMVGITPATAAHYDEYARNAVQKAHLKKGDLVVDIGCGNGALMQSFEQLGMRVVGIDPALEPAPAANNESAGLYSEFFTPSFAGDIVNKHGKASLVTANFVMGSVDNLHAFIAAVRHLLKPDGLFIAEEPYLADIIDQGMFDAINHKRLSFITAGPFQAFLKTIQMHMIDIQRNPFRRGIIHMTMQRSDGPHVSSPALEHFIEEEKEAAFYSIENMNNFAGRIEELKNAFRKTVADLKTAGNKLAGYGATGRTITFILECGWQSGVLEFIADEKPYTQQSHLAGTEIPVLSPDALLSQKPSHVIIFSYHDADHIMEKNKAFADQGGKFIIPFPGLKIV